MRKTGVHTIACFCQQQQENGVDIRKEISTKEKGNWTHEPEYDTFLHVRVHKPETEYRQTKCIVNYKDKFYKTGTFDEEVNSLLNTGIKHLHVCPVFGHF